jgi:hypothetical protein
VYTGDFPNAGWTLNNALDKANLLIIPKIINVTQFTEFTVIILNLYQKQKNMLLSAINSNSIGCTCICTFKCDVDFLNKKTIQMPTTYVPYNEFIYK